MIERVVFFTGWPLNQRDYERCGADILRKAGFEVSFYDLSSVLYPGALRNGCVPGLINSPEHPRFHSRKEALAAIEALDERTFAVILFSYNRKTFWVYKAVSRTRADYAIDVLSPIPSYLSGASTPARKLLKRISRVTPGRLFRYISGFAFRAEFSRRLGIREPRFWLAAGATSPDYYRSSYPSGPRTEIMWLHSMDYNLFLKHRSISTAQNPPNAVFLDGGAPKFLGDDAALGRPSVMTEERYYPSICRFFDQVEKETGLEVRIASHPRSEHPDRPDYFGGRAAFRDRTCEMIAASSLVIVHASTAVNFAVLFRKPMLFITTSEYEAVEEKNGIRAMAGQFGRAPVNIDALPVKVEWSEALRVDDRIYDGYRNDFIKRAGSLDADSWEIFAERLKAIGGRA